MSSPDIDFDKLSRRPDIAWPTLALFAGALVIWFSSTTAALAGMLPTGLAIALNTIAAFWMFTVFHDASHNAVSQNRKLNDGIGRVAILFLSPLPIFRAFRFIHMQHHRFANETRDRDPDAWCGGGRWWTLPFRWATLDLFYYWFYLPRLKDRPAAERRETLASIVLGVTVVAALISAGYGLEMLLYWLIPARFAIFWLALAFDYLPHHPHGVPERDNRWKATSNRVGMEWLLTPILLYQNYHLVHHLYPRAPFYRYLKLWHAREAEHLSHSPYLISPTGRPLAKRFAQTASQR